MFGGISPIQLVIVLVIVILIFGTKKLRNMGKDIGGAVKGFKDGMKDPDEDQSEKSEEEKQLLQKKEEADADFTDSKQKDKSSGDN